MLRLVELERSVAQLMAAARVPGLAVALVQAHRLLYAHGFGVTSAEDGGAPVTPATLFPVGSVTKPLTGTLIMRLVDAGALALDRPVRADLPWLTLSDPTAAARITPRMLLTHTSGLPHDHGPYGQYGPRDPDALARRVRDDLPRFPLVGAPGERFVYSGAGYHLLAHVAEVVTGRRYPELMRDLVFAPLEVTRTTFDPTLAMTYPLAPAHAAGPDGAPLVVRPVPENAGLYASGRGPGWTGWRRSTTTCGRRCSGRPSGGRQRRRCGWVARWGTSGSCEATSARGGSGWQPASG